MSNHKDHIKQATFEGFIQQLELAGAFCADGMQLDKEIAIDQAITILQQIYQWTNAYPEDIFIPMTKEDWQDAHHHLRLANRSGSAMAADCMRHTAKGIKEIIDREVQQ